MAAFLRVMDGGFVIDHGADRIGHGPCRPGRAGIADKVHLVGKAFVEAQQRAVGQRALGIELLSAGGIEVRSLAGEHHHPRAVFHNQGVAFGKGEIELVGQAAPPVFAAIQAVFFKHDDQALICFGVGTVGRTRAGASPKWMPAPDSRPGDGASAAGRFG